MFRDFQVLGFQGSGIWRFRHFGGPGLSLSIIERVVCNWHRRVWVRAAPYTTLINVNPDQ